MAEIPVRMGALFTPEPDTWGLRGDPFAWRALADRLSDTAVPAARADAARLLADAFEAVVGAPLHGAGPDAVQLDGLAGGGMSSGQVHLPTWREHLVPLLLDRAAAAAPR